MISLTMSRISSRARLDIELRELRQVDGLDQGAEDHASWCRSIPPTRGRPAVGAALAARGCDGGRAAATAGCGWPDAAAGMAPRRGAAGGQACRRGGCSGIGRRLPNIVRFLAFRLASSLLARSLSNTGYEASALRRFDLGAPGERLRRAARNISAASSLGVASRRSSGRCWPPCRRAARRTE